SASWSYFTCTITQDKYGRWYFSPGVGANLAPFGASFTEGYLDPPVTPDTTASFITGWDASVGGRLRDWRQ
ncbi:MAG TPA: hypothetical protein VI756_28670, partial [Blastocatellia bacterium]